ncbi:MAG: hypothetical protein K8T25_01690 [Planctomycetia bacterium]|jgi:uncharacterized repeat protein (TIGR04138 family)|nr:hypothetical protein [Planctomycetia bacterium]
MVDPRHPIAKLAKEDGRYHVDAYAFVFDALSYAHTVLGLGAEQSTEEKSRKRKSEKASSADDPELDRHLTGQELCQAIRQYALDQYGYLAKCVFNSWGVQRTSDFGEIVFRLIEAGQMRKTPSDRREDFDDVFDFNEELVQHYKITLPE